MAVDLQVSGTLPVGVAGQAATTATITVSNRGNTATDSSFRVDFYLSADSRFNTSNDTLLDAQQVGNLLPGASRTFTFGTASTAINAGAYFPFFVVDPDESVPEFNRANNTIGSTSANLLVVNRSANVWQIQTTSASDTISLSQSSSSYTLTVNGRSSSRSLIDVTRFVINDAGGNNRIDLSRSTFAAASITTLNGRDTISGTQRNDTILSGSGNDSIVGNGGNDRIEAQAGNDTLRGGDGSDTLIGGSGVDSLFGDAGDDRLDSRDSSRDILNGGTGTNRARVDSLDQRTSIQSLIS